MTDSGIKSFCLPLASVNDFVTKPVGGLEPMPANEARTDTAAFTALDCFDQALRSSKRLLLRTDTALNLLSDHIALVSQASHGKARFITEMADGPVKRALGEHSTLRSLLAVGTGHMHTATAVFVDDEGKTHCRVNLMQLVTQHDRVVIIELQGIKGYDPSANLLRERIVQLGGAPLSCDVLYQRLFPDQAVYNPKPEILIAGDDTAFEAAHKIISSHIPLLRANEAGIIADHDTEFLHDYRVHLRKIRSVISLFKGVYDDEQTAVLKTGFSNLMAPTGALRDLDVYLLDRQRLYSLLPEALHPGLSALFGVLVSQRDTEQKQVAHHLESPAYEREISRLAKFFAQPKGLKRGIHAQRPALEYARDRIWRRFSTVHKIAAGIGPDTPDAQIHELRIHCKKLRYLIEFFGAVFPAAELDQLLKSLRKLQNELGMFNDYSVQQARLSVLVSNLGEQGIEANLEIAQSVGALVAILHNHQIAQRARIFKKLKQFNQATTQQAFEQLFQQRQDNQT